MIANKANLNTFSYAKPNISYMNPKYGGFYNGIKRFSGKIYGDRFFKVEEWEVWSVVFSKNQPYEVDNGESDSSEDCSVDCPEDCSDDSLGNK